MQLRSSIAAALAAAAVLTGASAAQAAILNAAADTYVYNRNADTPYGASTVIQVANDGGSSGAKDKDRLGVIRFDVSSITDDAVAASLMLTSTTDFEFHLYGVNDGGTDENFNEATLTFNTFAYSAEGVDGGGNGSLVTTGLTQLASNVTDASDGTADNILTFDTAALVDFINADANGIVTFIIYHAAPQNGNYANFASREASAGVPQLSIEVPEPASLALMGLGGLLLFPRRRR